LKLVDLRPLHGTLANELIAAFTQVLASGEFVGGERVESFEEAFAQTHGVDFGAGCGSGTDALALALRALGIGGAAEVIVPAMTFVATAEAVIHAGAVPVIVDVDPNTLLIDPRAVEGALSPRTRAIIPVHLYGNPVPLDLIDSWRARGLAVIEDAAQAHLASWLGRKVGSAGDVGCFSFYPGKNLGALGDGGIVISRDTDVIARVKRLRDHGAAGRYEHVEVGYCSRLDGLQAALLSVKLSHLAEWNRARRRIASVYHSALADVDGISLVPWSDGSVHHLFPIRIAGGLRDSIRAALSQQGIETGIHYPLALSRQASLEPWVAGRCPIAEQASDELLSLPMHAAMTESDAKGVSAAVISALNV